MLYKQSISKVISNILAYQVAWFASAWLHDYRAVIVSLILLAWIYYTEAWSKQRFKATVQCACFGIGLDWVLMLSGVIEFSNNSSFILPLWLICLWIVFATTLTNSLNWLMHHPLIAGIVGAVFGPLAYFAGSKFGALSISESFLWGVGGIWFMAVFWFLLLVMFSALIRSTPNYMISATSRIN